MTPPLRKTASWWTQHGLGRAGALEADWVLPAVRAIVSVVTDVALDAAVREAKFQVRELSSRGADFAATYLSTHEAADPKGTMVAIMAFEPIVAALLRSGFDGDKLFDCLNEAICNAAEDMDSVGDDE